MSHIYFYFFPHCKSCLFPQMLLLWSHYGSILQIWDLSHFFPVGLVPTRAHTIVGHIYSVGLPLVMMRWPWEIQLVARNPRERAMKAVSAITHLMKVSLMYLFSLTPDPSSNLHLKPIEISKPCLQNVFL